MEKPLEKIALLLDNLGPNQLAYLAIRNAAENKKDDTIFFFVNIAQPLARLRNASMAINELYGYECKAIATDVTTAEILSGVFGPTEKYFYVWDLEFISYHGGEGQKSYSRYKKAYTDPNLKLVARTEEHARIIEQTFGRRVEYIMPEMSFVLYRREDVCVDVS